LPSFLDFFCYIFFYAGSVAGVKIRFIMNFIKPAYDYFEWDEFMDLKGNYSNLPASSENLKESFRLLGKAAIFSVVLLGIGPLFPLEHVLSEEYLNKFIFKVFIRGISFLRLCG